MNKLFITFLTIGCVLQKRFWLGESFQLLPTVRLASINVPITFKVDFGPGKLEAFLVRFGKDCYFNSCSDFIQVFILDCKWLEFYMVMFR